MSYTPPLDFHFSNNTTPQATPVPNLAAFPTASGAARCRKSQFLTPLSWTERPTPTRVSWPKLPLKSYPSWYLLSALQCRLDCNPGYVAHKTPIITCVRGKYQPKVTGFDNSFNLRWHMSSIFSLLDIDLDINIFKFSISISIFHINILTRRRNKKKFFLQRFIGREVSRNTISP